MLFDIIKDSKTGMQVTVKPETLSIKIFKDVWDKDKDKNKENAFIDFAYIYHSCDYNSPYSNYSELDRVNKIALEVLGNVKYKPSKEVILACEVYKELIDTPITKMYMVTKNKVNEIVDFIKDVVVDEDNIKSIQTMVKDFTTFASSYKELEALVRKEKEGIKNKIRGDKSENERYSV